MKTFELEKYARARVWIDELPKCEYVSSQILTYTVQVGKASNKTARRAAIELLVPLGARSMYALIGGEYVPENRGALDIDICALDNGDVFPESLASPTDRVEIGLPREYVRGVIEGIRIGCAQSNNINPGKLRIACAAHGAMWSSEAIYIRAASILTKLINLDQEIMSDEAVAEILSEP